MVTTTFPSSVSFFSKAQKEYEECVRKAEETKKDVKKVTSIQSI